MIWFSFLTADGGNEAEPTALVGRFLFRKSCSRMIEIVLELDMMVVYIR